MKIPEDDKQDIDKNKELAAVSYAWAMSVIVLLAGGESKFVRFHARQAASLFVVSVVFWFIPYAGRYLEILVIVGMLAGLINAFQGEYFRLPVIGGLAAGEVDFGKIWGSCQERMICAINLTRRIIKREKKKEEFLEIEKMMEREK